MSSAKFVQGMVKIKYNHTIVFNHLLFLFIPTTTATTTAAAATAAAALIHISTIFGAFICHVIVLW